MTVHRSNCRATLAIASADALPLADASVDLVFTSPPYMNARTYGINAGKSCARWLEWMLPVVAEMCRVSRGLVLVNCAGVTRKWCYWPACEGLLWEWWKQGGECWRPAYWHRVGIAGSGGKQWLRADVEYVLVFKAKPGKIPWADNTANGHPPKWAPGGAMSHRLSDGARVNQWGHSIGSGATVVDGDMVRSRGKRPSRKLHTKRKASGSMEQQTYIPPVLANPGNLVKVKVGGGHMGHPFAHENEAPMPQALAEWFIRGWCPPGGIVLDPFAGSGTTLDAALTLGRNAIGFDIRQSQVELAARRLRNPHTKKTKQRPDRPEPLLWEAAQ